MQENAYSTGEIHQNLSRDYEEGGVQLGNGTRVPATNPTTTVPIMKKILLPLLVLGLATTAFAGTACGSGCDKPQAPACQCGDGCKTKCGDKCDCAKQQCYAPKAETKK
mgnify:CR=1 FL=1